MDAITDRNGSPPVPAAAGDLHRRQAALLDSTADGIVTWRPDGCITFWNKGAERLFGWTREEVLGRDIAAIIDGEEERALLGRMTDLLAAQGSANFERAIRNRREQRLTVEVRMSLVHGDDGRPQEVLAIVLDVTERRRAEDAVHRLAFHDQLTGLPNRRLLSERIGRAVVAGARTRRAGAVLMIDLDHFKAINDTVGHALGDELLRQAAARLTRLVRERDTVARFGGDEFALLLEDLGEDDATAVRGASTVAQKIADVMCLPYELGGYRTVSSASIGITLFGAGKADPDTLIKQADLAMYRAKADGRNLFRFYEAQLEAAVAARAQMQADLREALQTGGLELHYQPQVDARGRVVGVEALIRWKDPRRGQISPADFIPLAEETGLINALGDWLMLRAFGTLARWAAMPGMAALTMSVNVSIHQFRRPDFEESLRHMIGMTRADPARLKLEITESVLADDMDLAVAKIRALKGLGIRFALDDFGTGYSSLAYLKRLPMDQLKIDRAFIQHVPDDRSDAAIARTVIGLGRVLGMEVIAEGVETPEQRDFLLEAGCGLFQGYLYARPLPEKELPGYVAAMNAGA